MGPVGGGERGELDVQTNGHSRLNRLLCTAGRLSHAAESTTRGVECSDMTKGRGGH